MHARTHSSSETDVTLPKCAPVTGVSHLARSLTLTSLDGSAQSDGPEKEETPPSITSTDQGARSSHPKSQTAPRPFLYTSPSFAGSTESTRLKDQISCSISSSSWSASSQFNRNSENSSATIHQQDRTPPSLLPSPNKKRNYDSGYASSQLASESHGETDWSASSLSLSICSETCPATPPTPSPYVATDYSFPSKKSLDMLSIRTSSSCYFGGEDSEDGSEKGNGNGNEDEVETEKDQEIDIDLATTLLDPRYVMAGDDISNAPACSDQGWPGMYWIREREKERDRRKYRERNISSASSMGWDEQSPASLESPFEDAFD